MTGIIIYLFDYLFYRKATNNIFMMGTR